MSLCALDAKLLFGMFSILRMLSAFKQPGISTRQIVLLAGLLEMVSLVVMRKLHEESRKMEIPEYGPGPELNALVLEKVYGLRKVLVPKLSLPMVFGPTLRNENAFPREDSYLFVNQNNYPQYFWGHCNDIYQDEGFTVQHVPAFSEDIEQAWSVVQTLQPNWLIDIDWEPKPKEWYCRLVHNNGDRYLAVSAPTAPHAICLAAIQAHDPKGGKL